WIGFGLRFGLLFRAGLCKQILLKEFIQRTGFLLRSTGTERHHGADEHRDHEQKDKRSGRRQPGFMLLDELADPISSGWRGCFNGVASKITLEVMNEGIHRLVSTGAVLFECPHGDPIKIATQFSNCPIRFVCRRVRLDHGSCTWSRWFYFTNRS